MNKYCELSVDFIPGVCVGFSIVTDPEILEDGDKAVFMLDLFIIRVLIFYGVRA